MRSGADLLSLNHWSHLLSFFLWFFFFLSHQSRLIGHNELLLLGLSPFPQSPSHFLFQKTWNNQNDLFAEGRQEICQYFEMKLNCFIKKDFCRIAVFSYPLNFILTIETHQVFKMILSVLKLPPTFFFQHPVWIAFAGCPKKMLKEFDSFEPYWSIQVKSGRIGPKTAPIGPKVQDNMDDPNLS